MDWSNYSDMDDRETNKMYDDIQVDKWEVTDGKLIPAGTSKLQEKARYINSDKGSNKYNITQTIAETFGIFCVYEYKCETNGQFIKTYVDESGRNMTGRTAVFYNRAIKTDNPFTLDYQKNLQSISRTCDSTEVYTKLFVDPIQSDTMTDGYVTIANTTANPLMDEFILNFDYLYSKGSITEYQKDFIDKYSVETHEINEELRNKGELINLLTVEINDKKAEKAGAEKSVSAIQEELTHYQTLRDNDVTNTPVVKDKNNSYSVAFVKDNDKTSPYYRADLRLEGILSSSINGYKNYKYEEAIFTSKNLISSQDFKSVAENDKNMYVVLDEDGYAIGLYTGYAEWFKADDLENDYIFDTGYIVYLALQYSPHNKYVEVCNRFERMITKNKKQIAICDNFIESKQVELDELIASQSELLARKNSLNQKLEYIMGPALREGHWSAEDYEDIGRKTETTIKVGDKTVDDVSLVFDTELFDGEEKGYYYASAEDASSDIRTYYDYIDISSYITSWRDKNPEDLVIHLTQPEFRYTVTESQVNGLSAGNYFILYNMTKYYFNLSQALETGNILRIQSFSGEAATPIVLQMSTDNGVEWTNIAFEAYDEEKNYANLTDIFEGLNKYLSTYKIYPNTGFIYGFISQEKIAEDSTDKTTTAVKPVLLLNNPEINYSIYKQINYSFGNESVVPSLLYKTNEELVICYPRIVITKNNVNYDDDLLTITEENVEKALVKFEDYSVLLRNGQPRFNLKVTKNTTPYALLNKNYTIAYRISQANEMLYRDALEVARENSRPRFSYDVSVAQLPDTVESYELGQLGYINDSALGVKAAKGYISSITLVLDSPKDDEIQIQNYKTKFEDLFATITASSEAMKSNQQSYDIAASIINPSTGNIQGSILQDSFNNNKVELTYSNTQVHIDDTDGITLTNTEPYSNGVYGQVVMRGGGIFLSNSVDSNYNRIWTTGITPNGINASTITTGQLDANLVRIFAGNNVAFQWNSEGIYAYKRDENNQFLPNTYVRYSDKGLQYLDDGFTAVDLGWNGLAINTQGGSLTLTGKDGLVVYDGLQNDSENPTNHLIKIGKFEENENVSYGMRLYKPITIGEDTSYAETLITSNDGHLWLKDYIEVGNKTNSDDGVSIYGAGVSGLVNSEDDVISGGGANLGGSSGSTNTGGAGLSGVGDPNKSVRFWAGSSFDTRDAAPFRVLQDGTCYATSLYIGGNSSINGSSVNDIVTVMNNYNSKLFSSNGFVYNRETTTQTILFCSATKNGVEVAALPDNYLLTLEYCERSSGEWFVKQTSFGERFNVTVDMDENYSYRSVLKYIDSKGELQAVFGDVITFIAVSNGEQGDSIDTINEWYATSTNINITPTDWKDSLEEVDFSQDNPYLWVKEVYNYSNGTSSEPVYRIAAVYGQKGVGIEKISNYYLVTNLKTGVKIEGNAWILVGPEEATKEIPNTTYFCPYLWHYEKIRYTDGSSTNTSPRLIEVRGVSITGVTNQYILSTSNNEIVDQEGNARKEEDWKNSYEEAGSPSAEWPYLWSREVVNYDEAIDYESGDKFKILPARLIATYGDGVVGIDEYYLLADTNSVSSLPTDWGKPNPEEVPIPTSELRFLWNKEVKKYTNGREEPTSPRVIGMYGEIGGTGPAGRSVVTIIEEYVLSSSNQDPLADEDSKWEIEFKAPTEKQPFLWNREGIWYSDEDSFVYPSDPAIIATYVKDGRGIEEIRNYYCIYEFSSGVEAGVNKEGYTWEGPDFSENPIPVPTNEKPYLWNYEEIVWSDESSSTTDACVVGTLGLAGRGVEDIEEWYLYTETNGNQPESDDPSWSLTLPTFDSSKPYLWIKEIVTYNIEDENNSTTKEFIRLMSVSGQVSDIINYYWANDMSTAPSLEEYPLPPNEKVGTWTKEEQNTTLEKRYLWNCEVITYTVPDAEGNTSKTFGPRVIGVHGAKGDTGPAGISVANIEEVYGCSSDPKVPPTDWFPNPQVPDKDNPFLWCKETVTYDYDKDDQVFVRIIGTYSEDGRGITKIENYYWANTIITPPPSLDDYPLPPNKNYVANTWVKEEQTTSVENPYLWNCEVISYDKPASGQEENTPTILGPRLIGTQGKDGINGAPGRDIEQIEEQYARNNSVIETPSNWGSTFEVPDPSNQYLWAREKITYSTDTNNDGIKDVEYTEPRIISSYVEGGRGIEEIKNYYLASDKSSGVTKEEITKDYNSQRILLSSTIPYLWSVEKIIYTAGDPSYTTPFIAAYYSTTTYTWIKYADDANGTNMSDSPTGKTYMGIAYNKTNSNESSNRNDYQWSLIKGTDGSPGKNGVTYYTWIKYGVDKIGTSMVDDPNYPATGYKASDYIYIGIAYGKISPSESTTASDYTWSLFQGPQGLQGPTGEEGRGIEHIQEYYLRTNSTTPPTDGNPGWRDVLIPEEHTLIPTSQYLWMKEVVTYTDTTTKIFKHIIATYAPSGRGIKQIDNYYQITNSTNPPNFNPKDPESDNWESDIIDPTSEAPYLWNVELITWTESDGTESQTNTDPRIIGVHGADGTNAVNYRLQLSATSITKKLDGSFSPNTIICSVNKITETTTSNISISNFKLKVQKQMGNNKTEITTTTTPSSWTISLDSTMSDAESFILTLTNSDGTIIYDTLSVSCVISDELKALAEIDKNNGNVYIGENKVLASSIAAYAVTAGKIAAGAIETGGIAAGSELYLYTAGNNQTLASLPVYGSSWTNPETHAITTINSSSAYNSAIHTTLNYNYNYSTGGKMKLSSDGVEIKSNSLTYAEDQSTLLFKTESSLEIGNGEVVIESIRKDTSDVIQEQSSLTVSASGITASSATFDTLLVNGKKLFGGADLVIQAHEPEVINGPTIWIQPQTDTSQVIQKVNNETFQLWPSSKTFAFNEYNGTSFAETMQAVYSLKFSTYATTVIVNGKETQFIPNGNNIVTVKLYTTLNPSSPFVEFTNKIPITRKGETIEFQATSAPLANILTEALTMSGQYIYFEISASGSSNGNLTIKNGTYVQLVVSIQGSASGGLPCSVYYFEAGNQ